MGLWIDLWVTPMWFRVDDGFYDHPKAAGMSNDAVALWTRAGNWSARQLTDGYVPASMLATLAGNAADALAVAADLVRRRLWEVVRGGWQFHNWGRWNPTRAEVEGKRAAAAKRTQRWRERRGDASQERPGDASPERTRRGGDASVTRLVTDTPRSEPRDGIRDAFPTRPDPISNPPSALTEPLGEGSPPDDDDSRTTGNDLARVVAAEVQAATGKTLDPDAAADLAETLTAGRNLRDPSAYVRQAIRSEPEPALRFLPAGTSDRQPPSARDLCRRCGGQHPTSDCPTGRAPASVLGDDARAQVAKTGADLVRAALGGTVISDTETAARWAGPEAVARAQVADARRSRGEPDPDPEEAPDDMPF